MKFYLRTILPEEVMEINQAITLSGVLCEPWQLTRNEINVEQQFESLLDVMSEEQTLLVQAISNAFRGMLEEGKRLQKLSAQITMMVPATQQGLMALKASRRLSLPMAASQVFQLEQAMVALHAHAGLLILDLDKISRFASAKKVLKSLLKTVSSDQKENLLVVCETVEQLRMAMACGAECVAASADVYHQLLFSVLSDSEMQSIREEWILTYTRNTVLE